MHVDAGLSGKRADNRPALQAALAQALERRRLPDGPAAERPRLWPSTLAGAMLVRPGEVPLTTGQWFVLEGGKRGGPFTLEHILQRLWSASDPQSIHVWREGMEAWVSATSVADFAGKLPPPPPSSDSSSASSPVGTHGAPDDATLNPVRLWALCFRWRGRFSRLQFAVASLGAGLVAFALGLAMSIMGGMLGTRAETLDSALNIGILLLALPLAIGAGVRRLHDLGCSGWLMALAFLPCVGLGMLLYLLFTPRRSLAVSDDVRAQPTLSDAELLTATQQGLAEDLLRAMDQKATRDLEAIVARADASEWTAEALRAADEVLRIRRARS